LNTFGSRRCPGPRQHAIGDGRAADDQTLLDATLSEHGWADDVLCDRHAGALLCLAHAGACGGRTPTGRRVR